MKSPMAQRNESPTMTPSSSRKNRAVTFSPEPVSTKYYNVTNDDEEDHEEVLGSPINKMRRSTSALGLFAGEMAGLTEDLNDFSDVANVTISSVKSNEYASDDDDDDEEGAKRSENDDIEKSALQKRPSWVRSMNDYMMRRLRVMEHVATGAVVTEQALGSERRHITRQGDLEMYSDAMQLARGGVKRSDEFRDEVKLLWKLVSAPPTSRGADEDGDDGMSNVLRQGNYTKMITKFARVIVPPPWSKEQLVQTAMEDWEKDLEAGRKAGHLAHILSPVSNRLRNASSSPSPSSSSSSSSSWRLKEEACLNFKAFFDSIFQLCDTWTETADLVRGFVPIYIRRRIESDPS